MKTIVRLAIAATVLLTPELGSARTATIPAKVGEVLDRTQRTDLTYAVYKRSHIDFEGAMPARDGWSAEFHSGAKLRVETLVSKALADCDARDGVLIIPEIDKITRGREVADLACGITLDQPVLQAEWLGEVDSEFGRLDRIRIVTAEVIMTFDVNPDGVTVNAVFQRNDADKSIAVEEHAVAIETALPEGPLFDEAALDRSFIPERVKALKPDHP